MDWKAVTDEFVEELRGLRFGPPVTHVYNPLEYARAPYDEYLARYGRERKEVVLLGMNPGPWGMAQTGIPFGEVEAVRGWLGIDASVGGPCAEHPRRRVLGFSCRRSEVSGRRLWGWARATFGTPERFFGRFFVANYCPLLFLEESGRNRTPDHLPVRERDALLAVCDRSLRRVVELLSPAYVVGVGRFAESRARAVLAGSGPGLGWIPHPSPASPSANRDWEGQVVAALRALGIEVPRAGFGQGSGR